MNAIVANTAMSSAIYEGRVRHRRMQPTEHAFNYKMAQLYLDLDEVDRVFAGRWLWSARHRNVAEFRRSDYLDPATPSLSMAVRDRVQQATGSRPEGAIRLLTHPRYFGHVFNPVSFYYCHDADGALHSVLAEITNTPWRERHAYVLPVSTGKQVGRSLHWSFDKAFHVSPFIGMKRQYQWSFTAPAADLLVHMDVLDDGHREFDATLSLRRRELDGPALARVLLRYPMMTAQVVGAIHWQALRLWLKKIPVHDHPSLPEQNHE